MGTDSYDEVFQGAGRGRGAHRRGDAEHLREEAHLTDVIDPLGGSFYVESLTDAMEEKILDAMKTVDDAGGMYKAVESGLVQRMIGASALRFQQKVDSGEQTIVGVNAYRAEDEAAMRPAGWSAPPAAMQAHLDAMEATTESRRLDPVTLIGLIPCFTTFIF